MNGQIKFMNLYLNNGLRHFKMTTKFQTEMARISLQTFTSKAS